MAVRRRHALSAKARPGHRIHEGRPHQPSTLVCRWHLDPASGRPVCAWNIDDVPSQDPAGSGSAPRRLDRNKVKGTAGVVVTAACG
jgi:hypothetical protein